MEGRSFSGSSISSTHIILAVLFVVFLLGCISNNPPVSSKKFIPNLADCAKIPLKHYGSGCYTRVAIAQRNPDICAALPDVPPGYAFMARASYLRDYCYKDVATALNDSRICDRLEDRYYCYDKIALTLKNDSLCLTTACLNDVAIALNDPHICDRMYEFVKYDYDNISARISKDWCKTDIADNTGQYALCGQVEDLEDKENCLSHNSGPTANITICEGMQVEQYKVDCMIAFAKATQNVSICDKIEFKATCLMNVAVGKNDTAICDRIPEQDRHYLYQECYMLIGLALKNASICDKIEFDASDRGLPGVGRTPCFQGLALANSDPSLCQKLGGSQVYCITDVAKSMKDPAVCEMLNNRANQDECLNSDPEVCEMLHHPDYRDVCLSVVASAADDISICEKIQNPTKRQKCLWSFGKPS